MKEQFSLMELNSPTHSISINGSTVSLLKLRKKHERNTLSLLGEFIRKRENVNWKIYREVGC